MKSLCNFIILFYLIGILLDKNSLCFAFYATPFLIKRKILFFLKCMKDTTETFYIYSICIDRYTTQKIHTKMRIILHCVLILAFAFLLKHVYYLSSLLKPSREVKFYLVKKEVKLYKLAVQWPPGVCSGKSKFYCTIKPVPTEFKIHGLWPKPEGASSSEVFNAGDVYTTDRLVYFSNLYTMLIPSNLTMKLFLMQIATLTSELKKN